MEKIGEGWQYAVYDMRNGRVLKKFHSLPMAYWVIGKDVFASSDHQLASVPSFVRSMKEKARESFAALKRCSVPDELIGNPHFLNGLDYEQDKVTPLGGLLSSASIRDQKGQIDRFIDFCKVLYGYGLIDKSFNITKNFGVMGQAVILTDIGELFDDKEIIERQIIKRAWTKAYVTDGISDAEVRAYFIAQMDKTFLSK